MSQIAPITVNVDELIAVNKYEVDEESAHIELVEDPDIEEFKKLVRLRRLPGVRHLPHRLRGHHREEVGEPPAHHGRGVPLRVGCTCLRKSRA